ncbi:zf-HC2 domain-containing protein [Cohnella algarum]|uniref:zf-HC2 domain-containing protein n=1 Tax=Cohnella algarum TaxID=2044859 RepID=UPI0019676D1C|nr:zf-HC2 domain-containing protein [Cohnella algarum]MBN2984294.1 zf-HC2 domain-containing protein [Cohnella algarum]
MKTGCDLIRLKFSDYCEGSASESERRQVEEHLSSCACCFEEYRLWEESASLIRSLPMDEEFENYLEKSVNLEEMNRNVMNRIYAEQNWFMPAVQRSYAFGRAFRIRVAGLLASLLAVFACGFLYVLADRMMSSDTGRTGVMETASAFSVASSGSRLSVDVPVASLSDPIVLHASPAYPEYWIALSLLGVVMTLLVLNWFTRVRT